MRINDSRLFPYPVLTEEGTDYMVSKFKVVIDSALETKKKVKITSEVILDNENLINLISKKEAKIIYHLECSKTKYRTVKDLNIGKNVVVIESNLLSGSLEIIPLIVSTKDISNYLSKDFNREYEENSFDIENGNILAIGKQQRIPITKEIGSPSKITSIFNIIRGNEDEERMTVDSSKDKIEIRLPEKDYQLYLAMQNGDKFIRILHSMVIIPALITVLTDAKDQLGSGVQLVSDNRWFKSISKKTKEIFGNDLETELEMPGAILDISQKILDNPLTDSMESLSKMGEEQE